MEVLCDDQPITIRELNGVSYAVIPNTASYFECEEWETDPWGEPFSQDYRYTPFQVKATDSESRCTQISLHLDGSKAGGKIMTQRHNSHVFKGLRQNLPLPPLCFSHLRVPPPQFRSRSV